MLNTPVLFLIFNRLESAKQVFKAIKEAAPRDLYIAADGPRQEKEGEREKCQVVRDYVLNNIDWQCNIHTLFREKNLGCKDAVSSAITWFFSEVEEGIILEDDCLPTKSFFCFMEQMLEKYRNDNRIFMVSGVNLLEEYRANAYDYFFSKYAFIWGWGSWKRAWKFYDREMKSFPEYLKSGGLKRNSNYFMEFPFWKQVFSKVYNGNSDTWDYQWMFTCFSHAGLCIVPTSNLVKNIGFGPEAVRTRNTKGPFSNLHTYVLEGKYRDPPIVSKDIRIDRKLFYKVFFNVNNIITYLKAKLPLVN